MPAAQRSFTFEQAKTEIQAIISTENERPSINPICHTRVLDHGQRQARAIVFYHGFSTCPEQFTRLASEFHNIGYNVLIPRLPRHGRKDTLTRDLQGVTVAELTGAAAKALDLAQGLGEQVIVAGISMGGSLALWLAQRRTDIALATSIAPMLGLAVVPAALNGLVELLFRSLPNFYMWWDPRTKDKNPYVYPYSYPGYPTHALSPVMRIGLTVMKDAARQQPGTQNYLLVTNGADLAVSNPLIEKLGAALQTYPEVRVQTYEFSRDFRMLHDIITPECPTTLVDVVYPKIIELTEQALG